MIDVFYKAKALHEQGVKIILHCFEYGERTRRNELEELTEKVNYYKRDTSTKQQLSRIPYIVASRKNEQLLINLKKDNYPILAEGLHCAAFINHPDLKGRNLLLRMHNIEWQYYDSLAREEAVFWKKMFFYVESKRLKYFEKIALRNEPTILSISEKDDQYFKEKGKSTELVFPFHRHQNVKSLINELGDYALFHGKLSVSDNLNAALFLIEEVFSKTDFPFIIAGKEAPQILFQAAKPYSHIQIQSNLTSEAMANLQTNAQMHVLWTFQTAGMKLKLLDSLYAGRHCLLNSKMVTGTGLENLCQVANQAEELLKLVEKFRQVIFNQKDKNRREVILGDTFSNRFQAKKIVKLIRQKA